MRIEQRAPGAMHVARRNDGGDRRRWRQLSICLVIFVFGGTILFTSFAGAASLVGHWSFDDSTADDSAGSNNGSFINGTGTAGTVAGGGGSLGGRSLSIANAATSNGARVEVPHAASLAIGDNLSVSFWMNGATGDQPNGFTRTLGKNGGATTDPGWEYQRNSGAQDNRFRIDTATSGNQVKGGSNSAFNGSWHHIVTTLTNTGTSGTGRFYVDGVLTNSFTYTHGSSLANTRVLTFGTQDGGGRPFNGLLDDISLWDTDVLNNAESLALYNLADTAALGYNASEANQLFEAFAAGTIATIDGRTWVPTRGLNLGEGQVGNQSGKFSLQLNAGGFGMATIPEPSTYVLGLIGLVGFTCCARHRRKAT